MLQKQVVALVKFVTFTFEQIVGNSLNQNERTTSASKRFPLHPAALFSDSFPKLPIRSYG